MIASGQLIEAVEKLSQHVPIPQRRSLQLANGTQYTIIVEEVASRCTFFEAMFRQKGFAESRDDEKATEVDLPDNEKFEHVYAYLMTGADIQHAIMDFVV